MISALAPPKASLKHGFEFKFKAQHMQDWVENWPFLGFGPLELGLGLLQAPSRPQQGPLVQLVFMQMHTD